MKRQQTISLFLCVLLVCTLFSASQIQAYAEESAVVQARSSVVRVVMAIQVTYAHEIVQTSGTGFLVSENGKDPRCVVTNKHVVDTDEILEDLRREIDRYAHTGLEDAKLWVFIDDKAYEIDYPKNVILSKSADLAVIKLDETVSGRKAAVLGNPKNIQVTDTIYAIGFPGIADVEDYENIAGSSIESDLIREYPSKIDNISVTKGSVSKKDVVSGGITHIQHDASISGGSSGGPLVNGDGQVIGVNTWSNSSSVASAYYAISVDNVIAFLKQNDIAYIDVSDIKPSPTPSPTPIPDVLPTFKMQPDNTTVNEGSKAVFKVEVTGKNISYQWQRRESGSQEWIDITSEEYSGANTATLTAPATEKSGTQFRCAVKNGAGTVYSNSVTLTINPLSTPTPDVLPTFKMQPDNTTVNEGSKAEFKVEATGENINYQWQRRESGSQEWIDITSEEYSGAKTATLTVPASEKSGTQFRCAVENGAGTVYSNSVSLTINCKPTISKQPASIAKVEGDTVVFSVTANGEDLSYQWQFRENGGTNWDNISSEDTVGAESPELKLPATIERNGMQFRCEVKNSIGTAYSDSASLKVSSAPVPSPEATETPVPASVFENKKLVISIAAAAIVLIAALVVMLARKKKPATTVEERIATTEKPVSVAKHTNTAIPIVRSLAPQHNRKKIALKDSAIIIGRSQDCNIIFAEDTPGVSTKHCSVSWEAGTFNFIIRDLGSTYGTYLETGMKLEPNKDYRLKVGESFYLGDKENMIKLELE